MTQDALFAPPAVARNAGRHETELERTITAARTADMVVDLDDALVSLARSLAWALDAAEAEGKPYAVAQVAGPYREVLEALRLTPINRLAEANDELANALAELREA
ncbi:hypothetical protein ACL1G5_10285 [Corynebacterium striatum]